MFNSVYLMIFNYRALAGSNQNVTDAVMPHITVVFKLTKHNFKAALQEFENQQLYFEFTASYLTLLLRDGKHWNVKINLCNI
ncbi:hypothetical protein WA1_21040 [Scytonema hofmannii PCC 7110]|uniref:Uncharacterized protein n=1 Tax=Scytonema hofmannii PCC 7110 TaxID=128403 RepID=A0A139XCS5_9CYAN|nr:hypothetical protein [Scytonema hofmannii]KYC42453.1 hypothetical protein WA1_21040 [Scytonema hofmannii PCC 7110]